MTDADLSKLRIDKGSSSLRHSRRRRWFVWGGVLLAIAGLLLVKLVLAPVVEVETATVSQVYPTQTFTLLNASGYVVAQRKAAVASKATGRLEWLGVEEGSRVKAGQILARLENRDAQATREQAAAGLVSAGTALEQAKAELNDATLAYKRQKELLLQGIVAQAEYDAAEARYKKARAAVSGAESNIRGANANLQGAAVAVEYTLIRAPFDAVVLTKNADVGDIVTPLGAAANAKAAVVTIADMGSLEVEADVSESNLAKVKAGQPCEILLDAIPDLRLRGEVHTIMPTADRSKASVMVKVRFIDREMRILPEMSAKVAFLERQATADEKIPRTAIPPSAVVQRNGLSVVYMLRGDRVSEVPVKTGNRIGEMVEVASGVKAGDKIVLKPLEKMKDGARIKVAEK
jgi:RND family efflux transporter MFP subunit